MPSASSSSSLSAEDSSSDVAKDTKVTSSVSAATSKEHRKKNQAKKESFGFRDVIRVVLMVSLVNFAVRKFAGGEMKKSTQSTISPPKEDRAPSSGQRGGRNLWKSGQSMELYVYLSTFEEEIDSWDDESRLIWHQSDLSYDCDARNERDLKKNLTLLPTSGKDVALGNETSFWAHIYFVKQGHPVDPSRPRYRRQSVVHRKYRMNRYVAVDAHVATRNLLSTGSDDETGTSPTAAIAQNRWIPRLRLHLVHDFAIVKESNRIMPKIIMDEIQYDDASGDYYVSNFRSTL